MQRYFFRFSVLITFFFSCTAYTAPLDFSEAHDFQRNQDEYMGDYVGEGMCAQVIALGRERYQANILSEFDTRKPPLMVIFGKLRDGKVRFKKKGWQGEIVAGAFVGTTPEGKSFTLKREERLSPTLGATPPADAVVLFDGSNTDAFVHPGSNPVTLDLSDAVGGEERVAYLETMVVSPEARTLRMGVGSDDGVKVWVNQQYMHGNNASRGVRLNQDQFDVDLNAGENTIRVKVIQGTGDWGVAVSLSTLNKKENLEGLYIAPSPSQKFTLTGTEGYLLGWRVSKAFYQEGKKGSDLFDVAFAPELGQDLSWKAMPKPVSQAKPCQWKLLEGGVMEVNGGGIVSKQKFDDHQVHLEFRTPFKPLARAQERGNSGVYLQGRYEVQILDSYGLEGVDNECGGIYKVAIPRVNMCAPPLQWQTYDITFRAPRFDEDGKLLEQARITVLHNGVLIHENQPIPAPTTAYIDNNLTQAGPLFLQDHGNPVHYRNIWVHEL